MEFTACIRQFHLHAAPVFLGTVPADQVFLDEAIDQACYAAQGQADGGGDGAHDAALLASDSAQDADLLGAELFANRGVLLVDALGLLHDGLEVVDEAARFVFGAHLF